GARVRRARSARRNPARGWGAARVEVWGWRDGHRDVVVYGVVEHTDIAAGSTLAVTTAALAGIDPVRDVLTAAGPGVRGLRAAVDAGAFLNELSRRGVRAAAFEGAAFIRAAS